MDILLTCPALADTPTAQQAMASSSPSKTTCPSSGCSLIIVVRSSCSDFLLFSLAAVAAVGTAAMPPPPPKTTSDPPQTRVSGLTFFSGTSDWPMGRAHLVLGALASSWALAGRSSQARNQARLQSQMKGFSDTSSLDREGSSSKAPLSIV